MATAQPEVAQPGTGRWAMIMRQFDYWLTVYRRTWKGSAASSFVMPLLYVAAMGILLGGFVDSSTTAGSADLEGASSYLAYVAPGLVAAHAMQTATGEVMWPVMGMIKWHRTYYGMIATPLSVADVVAAHFMFVLFRIATSCGVFLIVLAFFGVYESASGAIAAFFVQVLIGLAFATPLFAFSAGLASEAGFAVVYRIVIVPLFLFSGAFFPISNLSAPLEWLARVTPLWHGVDLTRMLTLGQVDWPLAGVHVLYLGVLAAAGWWWSVRRLTNRLVD
jgi:lipooligosaccharide transport system permease protein